MYQVKIIMIFALNKIQCKVDTIIISKIIELSQTKLNNVLYAFITSF